MTQEEKRAGGVGRALTNLVFFALFLAVCAGLAMLVYGRIYAENYAVETNTSMPPELRTSLKAVGLVKDTDSISQWYIPARFTPGRRATILLSDAIASRHDDKHMRAPFTKISSLDLKRQPKSRESILHVETLDGLTYELPIGNTDDQDVGFFDALTAARCKVQTCAPEDGLLAQRKRFRTKVRIQDPEPPFAPPEPPKGTLTLTSYQTRSGPLAAYISPAPKEEGVRKPIVIWAHGGFKGVGTTAFAKDKGSAEVPLLQPFLDAGLLLFYPSWRAENKNPGRFELFYGEVEDMLAAIDHVRALPYVDPSRVYIGGHSTGATIALLAMTVTDKPRAGFSIGGAPDMTQVLKDGKGYGNTPFDPRWREEACLRSAIAFTRHIQRPTFYLEDASSFYAADAGRMLTLATQHKVPFQVAIVKGKGREAVVAPLISLIASKIKADTDAAPLSLSAEEAQASLPK